MRLAACQPGRRRPINITEDLPSSEILGIAAGAPYSLGVTDSSGTIAHWVNS